MARRARCTESPAVASVARDPVATPQRVLAGLTLAASCLVASAAGAETVEAKAVASGSASTSTQAPPEVKDELPNAGYVPGYRADKTLGLSPLSPTTGALPGGMTQGYGAPMPSNDWSFRWSGSLNATLQFSTNERPVVGDGQSKTVVHVPPNTVDEYASFLHTGTMPGQWAQMNFVYGNPLVSANLSLATWNPTTPTTYYQIGSQHFINSSYLTFEVPPIGKLALKAEVGYFYHAYGALAQYGLGMYSNPLIGGARGIGENLIAEYDLGGSFSLLLEHGFMGMRNGKGPSCPSNLPAYMSSCLPVTPSAQSGTGNPMWPSAWMHHGHIGIQKKGDVTWKVRLHYLYNWAQDDRTLRATDDPTTRQIDESNVKDGNIAVYGLDASYQHPVYGYLGAAASYARGSNAYPVKGIVTFGGDGETLTNRWWGQSDTGNGSLMAAGINYTASLGRILTYPAEFTPGPDLTVNAGFVIAAAWNDAGFSPFDGRWRHKYALDLQYQFLPIMGVGIRADRVVPSSKDSQETYHVISPRLVFKGDWDSRYTISVVYGKWLYGAHTHPEGSSVTPGERLDDQLFALNAQMWW